MLLNLLTKVLLTLQPLNTLLTCYFKVKTSRTTQTRSHKPLSSHSMKQSSSSSKLPPGHSKPQPLTKPDSPVQHKISSMPGQPGRSSSSSSKHNSSLNKIVAGGRGDGHHGRSQSHGGRHQQLIEDQLRQQERERQRHHREQYKHQQEHQQQQQQIAIALMQQVQSMYAGYDRSSSMGSMSRSISRFSRESYTTSSSPWSNPQF